VAGCEKRELLAWKSRSLLGCLFEFQRNTDAVCALIVQDDGAILAKVSTAADLDIDILGVFSSMMFATARILVRELGARGEVSGRLTIGTDYHLLVVMGITPKAALVTLCRTSFGTGLLEYQARILVPRMINCLLQPTSEER
jgi:predicted regulator of Ras-like GTPase activity (Roadblock/LC7/MglB family)